MVNSWSLLYDELYMKDETKHSKYWYDYDRNDPDRPNPFVDGHGDVHYPPQKEEYYEGVNSEGRYHPDNPNQDFWHEDGTEFIGNPYADVVAAAPVDWNVYGDGSYTKDTVTFNMNTSDMDFISANGGFEYTPIADTKKEEWVYESPDGGKTVTRRKPGSTSKEVIKFPTSQVDEEKAPHFWQYEEDKTLKEVRDYLSGTYRAHYTSKESKTQTLDLIESIGDAEAFTRSNAIKYLSRFGKKDGKSKLDILKAIHYCILLYHFAGLHNANKNPYETF